MSIRIADTPKKYFHCMHLCMLTTEHYLRKEYTTHLRTHIKKKLAEPMRTSANQIMKSQHTADSMYDTQKQRRKRLSLFLFVDPEHTHESSEHPVNLWKSPKVKLKYETIE